MVVGSTNLGIHLYQAEASQQVQNLFLAAERANNQVAAERTQDEARATASQQVQDPSQTEDNAIQGDGRGAHSHTLEDRREEEEAPAEEKKGPPPDPRGLGQHIDLTG